MQRKIPFSEKELRVLEENKANVKFLDTPISYRENLNHLYWDKAPFWLPTNREAARMGSTLLSDQTGRGVMGRGTVDCFTREWIFEPTAGGSITKTGCPLFTDMNEWKEHITFPDVDAWDWEADAKDHTRDAKLPATMTLTNGFCFERMISLMDFTNASMALVDSDQEDALKEYLGAMADFGCKLVDKVVKYYPSVDGFCVHDDWGSQRSPFFSEEVAREKMMPFMKILNDHIHSTGRFVTLHSCGHVEDRVNVLIDAGFDSWNPQIMNDTAKLYDEVGDKMIIMTMPKPFDPENTTEDQQRQFAREYVDRFSEKGKPTVLNMYAGSFTTPAFLEEIYAYSRKLYSK